MKNLTRYLLALLLLTAVMETKALSYEEATSGVRNDGDHLLIIKMDRKNIGAFVEIAYSNGEVIVSQQLVKRKMEIDFGNVRVGEYTIRIKKGNDIQVYTYVKK